MSRENVVYQMDAKHVLYDIYLLEKIFKYIDDTDLPNVAQMCKLWRHSAIRENKKRYCIRQLHLPGRKIDHLARKLDYTIPFASLLIYNSILEKSSSPWEDGLYPWIGEVHPKGLEAELLEDCKNQLPNKTIVFEVDECLTTENVEFQGTKEQSDHELTDNCNIFGIFLRNVEQRFRVDVSWVWCHEWTSWQLNSHSNLDAMCNRVIGELGLKDCKYPKSTILMIGGHRDFLADLVHRAEQSGKEIIWAQIEMKKLVTNTTRMDLGTKQQSAAFLRISGPTVESWRTSILLMAMPEMVERQLHKLQKQVYMKRKRHYIGFLSGQNCGDPECSHSHHPCADSHRMMLNVKLYFPDIQFTGFFKKKTYRTVPDIDRCRMLRYNPFDGNDPRNKNTHFEGCWFFLSIIIISYD